MTHAVAAGVIPAWDMTDRLVKARKHAGLRQAELAEAAGISLRSVVGYETGRTAPRRPQLLAWAMACGVSSEWLQNGESPRPTGGPNGGVECAIRDSNPEPADSVLAVRWAGRTGERRGYMPVHVPGEQPARRNFVVPLGLPRQRTVHRRNVVAPLAAGLGARPTRPAGAFPHPRHAAEQAAA